MLNIFFSAPRSGSTRLGQIFKSQSIKFIDEAFHPDCENWGLLSKGFKANTAELLNCDVRDLTIEMLRQSQNITLIAKSLYKKKASFMLEIFPGHVSEEQIKELCKLYPVTILQRNLLDAFISAQKAGKIKKYENINTTDMKVTLRADKFKQFCQRRIEFYDNIMRFVLNGHGNLSIINYEDWCDYPNDQQCSIVNKLIQPQKFFFAASGADSFELVKGISLLTSDKSQQAPALNKQDISDGWQEKISNPNEFIQGCKLNNSYKFIEECPFKSSEP